MAALAKKDPGAVTICVENEFASRDDGLPGMEKKYGMKIPAGNIRKMDAGIIYTQVSESDSCLLGEVFTTDGRIKAMDLNVLRDDKNFFPNYNASPVVHEATFEKYPVIAELLDPLARKLTTEVAQTLNAKVDVDGGGSARGGEGVAGGGGVHRGGVRRRTGFGGRMRRRGGGGAGRGGAARRLVLKLGREGPGGAAGGAWRNREEPGGAAGRVAKGSLQKSLAKPPLQL